MEKKIDDNIKHTKVTFYTKTSQPLRLAWLVLENHIMFDLITFKHCILKTIPVVSVY